MSHESRRGLTLVELLVVVAIISILVALLVPAVQATREAARRAHCANNLRQVGLAIHQHADAHATFPAGFGWRLDTSYLTQILPYLEQKPLYDSINFGTNRKPSVESNSNTTVLRSPPAVLLCPSDPGSPSAHSWRPTNYAGNAGWDALRGEGVFIGRPLAPRDIVDGLSQTAAVAEWVVGSGEWIIGPGGVSIRADRRGSMYVPNRTYTAAEFEAFRASCRSLEPGVMMPGRPFKGEGWIVGGLGRTQYNHTLPPNSPSCSTTPPLDATSAGSLHAGGAHVLRTDGSAFFVKETIDPLIWTAIGTRSGREVVGDSALD